MGHLEEEKLGEETLEDTVEGCPLDESSSDDIEDVYAKEIKRLKDEVENYKERLIRTAAEYDNFRKRTEKEKLQTYSNATARTVLEILPVADSLELAEKSAEGGSNEYKKGIAMVKTQFDAALKKLGVESFGDVGEDFNPDFHNAVSHIDDKENEKENFISEVFQRGYKLQDKVIRHAMVQVAN